MLFPRKGNELGRCWHLCTGAVCWSNAVQGAMDPISVVIGLEAIELPREVDTVLTEHAIEVLASDRADEALNERMRSWRVRD